MAIGVVEFFEPFQSEIGAAPELGVPIVALGAVQTGLALHSLLAPPAPERTAWSLVPAPRGFALVGGFERSSPSDPVPDRERPRGSSPPDGHPAPTGSPQTTSGTKPGEQTAPEPDSTASSRSTTDHPVDSRPPKVRRKHLPAPAALARPMLYARP